jgi:hypothetical protein
MLHKITHYTIRSEKTYNIITIYFDVNWFGKLLGMSPKQIKFAGKYNEWYKLPESRPATLYENIFINAVCEHYRSIN